MALEWVAKRPPDYQTADAYGIAAELNVERFLQKTIVIANVHSTNSVAVKVEASATGDSWDKELLVETTIAANGKQVVEDAGAWARVRVLAKSATAGAPGTVRVRLAALGG